MYCGIECIVVCGMHCSLTCIGNVMYCDINDMCVDISTPGGDCADRPPGA